MPEQRAFAYFRCSSPAEIAIELQKRRVKEYCQTMNYDLFSEIIADDPCTPEQARQIATIYRKEMGEDLPLKMIVLNLHRLGDDIHTIRRIYSVFREYEIELESTCPEDNSLLAISEQEEYELFQALLASH